MTDDDPETTERIEEFQTGYRLAVTSQRGSDVRDQDEVKAVAKTETLEELENQRPRLHAIVTEEMRDLRVHQPDKLVEDDDGG